jgi:hypothetical protein
MSQPADPADPSEEEEELPEPVYGTVEEFVTERFVPMFRRPLGGDLRWCAQWWLHAEAISRLTALWYAWETLRLEPGTGMAVWYRDHLDHQLPILMGARGPFAKCTEDEHNEPEQMPLVPAPEGYWEIPEDLEEELDTEPDTAGEPAQGDE